MALRDHLEQMVEQQQVVLAVLVLPAVHLRPVLVVPEEISGHQEHLAEITLHMHSELHLEQKLVVQLVRAVQQVLKEMLLQEIQT
jgi:hypothetical protein